MDNLNEVNMERYDLDNNTDLHVVFSLFNETYAIDIKKVSVIENFISITRVPMVKSFMKGIINIRGEIVPIIDLKEMFEMKDKEYDKEVKIIVLKIQDYEIGILADCVEEVISISDQNIETTNRMDVSIGMEYIKGICKKGDKIITIINVDKFNDIVLYRE